MKERNGEKTRLGMRFRKEEKRKAKSEGEGEEEQKHKGGERRKADGEERRG